MLNLTRRTNFIASTNFNKRHSADSGRSGVSRGDAVLGNPSRIRANLAGLTWTIGILVSNGAGLHSIFSVSQDIRVQPFVRFSMAVGKRKCPDRAMISGKHISKIDLARISRED